MAVLDELLVGLGFDYDPEDLEQFEKDLESTTNVLKKFTAVVVAGSAALFGFAVATSAASDRQGKLADKTGVSVEEIDALEFALKRAGGEADAMGRNLEDLAIRISEAARGSGTAVEALGILGISATDASGQVKSADQIFKEVAANIGRFSRAEQIELADKLGLRDSILLLQQGSEGIAELTAEARALGVTTAEDAEISAQFQDSLVDIRRIILQVSRVIGRVLIPIMEDLSNLLTEWWKTNRAIIEQNVPKYIDALASAFKILTLAVGVFISFKLVTLFASLIKLMKGLTLHTLLFNAAIAAIPLLIGTLLASIALLAEDATTFFEGGESFIGDMIAMYPQWNAELIAVAATFATLAKLTGMVFDGWKEIFKLFTSGRFIEDFKLAIGQLSEDIKDFFKGIVDDFTKTVIDPIMEKIKGVKEFFTFDENPLTRLFGANTPDTIPSGVSNDVGATNNNTSSVKMGDINVSVNGDTQNPQVAGKVIGESIRKELEPLLKQSSLDLNSAVVV